MDEPFPPSYSPQETEKKWTTFWDENKCFQADALSKKEAYTIVIPPPNVTGVLHMGHALVNTLQDILIRWKRMSGYEALWVPGTDHAGIATQTVVERALLKEHGKRRTDYDRADFVKELWKWKEKSEGRILQQLKDLGCSCDWSRLRFTLDDRCSKAVKTAFKKLYDKGVIYRGNYLVNWDPVTQTALADDEVEYEEVHSSIWHIRYHLVGEPGYVIIATTRPETLLGDTAVAVHPSDERYRHLIGKEVHLPLTDRKIPIIADNHADPEFGTGALKVTPAHDPNDYQMGLKHDLPMINIFTPDGRINENGGTFEGMPREEARLAVIAAVKEQGLLEKIEPHTRRVGHSYRSKAVIEPYLSEQWFVSMNEYKKVLRDLVDKGDVKLLPESWKATYYHWIDNLRDWCISRQLWWGHRIPVWYHKKDPSRMICSDQEMPDEVAQNPSEWRQDPDVLDTWFSSALWPLSTLGWPDKTPDFEKFYPVNVLVTGHDILFFWVARMLVMGVEFTEKAPFPETFLHGLIFGKSYWTVGEGGAIQYVSQEERAAYDKGTPIPKDVKSKWEKLSKSKGNVIDPLEMIEEYGTDAVRMSLCASSPQGSQIDLDRRRFEEFKNFANKVWNGARFVFLNLEGLSAEDLNEGLDTSLFTLEDRWILSVMNRTNEKMHSFLEAYQFDAAALSAYDFFWKEFCAYYVEIVKPVLFEKEGSPELKKNKQKLLVVVLLNAVRLLHPMAPFITEELFHKLKERFKGVTGSDELYCAQTIEALLAPAACKAIYPNVYREKDINLEAEEAFEVGEEIVRTVRNIRGEMKIPPQTPSSVYLKGKGAELYVPLLKALVRCKEVAVVDTLPTFPLSATGSVKGFELVLPLPEELAEKEKERLKKEALKLENLYAQTENLLQNEDFLAKAAPELIEKKQASLNETKEALTLLKEKLQAIQ
jgi:valyl-tRNA synthetase